MGVAAWVAQPGTVAAETSQRPSAASEHKTSHQPHWEPAVHSFTFEVGLPCDADKPRDPPCRVSSALAAQKLKSRARKQPGGWEWCVTDSTNLVTTATGSTAKAVSERKREAKERREESGKTLDKISLPSRSCLHRDWLPLYQKQITYYRSAACPVDGVSEMKSRGLVPNSEKLCEP